MSVCLITNLRNWIPIRNLVRILKSQRVGIVLRQTDVVVNKR